MNNNITLHFACLSRFPRLCALAVMHLLVLIPLVLPADTFGPYTYTITDGQATITSFDRAYSGTLSITNKLGGYPVTSIGDDAFRDCSSLIVVTIPVGVTSIGFSAFSWCESLVFVTIPDSVTNIGKLAFNTCTSLTSIAVSENNPRYASIDGVLFDKTLTTLIQYPSGLSGSYTIPTGVTNIGDRAFSRCTSLAAVTLPDSVIGIGDEAFSDCATLVAVTIATGVTDIGFAAFSFCPSLTSVTIPGSVTNICGTAFSGCSQLVHVYFSGAAPDVGDDFLFYNAPNVTVYRLPGKAGWPTVPEPWQGRPTALWNGPPVPVRREGND